MQYADKQSRKESRHARENEMADDINWKEHDAAVQAMAKRYIEQGLSPIPLLKMNKYTKTENWTDLRLTEADVPSQFTNGRNVGVLLGDASNGLVDIDADCPEALRLMGSYFYGSIYPNFGRGGEVTHALARCPGFTTEKFIDSHLADQERERRKLGETVESQSMVLEARGGGLQTMFPPSIHPSGQRVEFYSETAVPDIDATELLRRCSDMAAAALIMRYWPVEGGRNEAALCIAGALLKSTNPYWDEATVTNFWNILMSVIPDDERKLRSKVLASTRKRIKNSPEKTVFGLTHLVEAGLMPKMVVDDLRKWLGLGNPAVLAGGAGSVPFWNEVRDEIFGKHKVVNRNGKIVVMTRKWHPSKERHFWEMQTFGDFRFSYINRYVMVAGPNPGDPPSRANLAERFLHDPARPTYQGTYMALVDGDPDWLNLWQGFAVEPRPGDWGLFREHIWENVCCKDREMFDYVMGWMAWKVQNPTKVPGVALVLRGKRGIGKNVFAEQYGRVFGQHYFSSDSPEQVTGRFSGHLTDCCLLVADEAFWAGDKKHESILKGLITSTMRGVEDKGIRAEHVENHVGLIVLSNDDFVVPAGEDERRFAVVDVGADHKEDFAYFDAIVKQMGAGGTAAMLHDLQKMDLRRFQVRKAPASKGLVDQKIENLEPFKRWVFECLVRGEVVGADAGEEGAVVWPEDTGLIVSKRMVQDAYHNWRRDTGVKSKAETIQSIGYQLKAWMNAPGEKKGIAISKQFHGTRRQVPAYLLPDLHTARDYVSKHLGGEIEWDDALEVGSGDGVGHGAPAGSRRPN